MLQDLRYAVRTLRKNPGFSLTAILTLGLGIGLNTAVFGIVNMLLFREPPVHEPARLVWITSYSRLPDGPRGNLTNPDIDALRSAGPLSGVVGYAEAPISIGTGRRAARVTGQIVNGDLFGLLGVPPARGRSFGAAENATPGAHPVAVIGDALWTRLFGADPGIIGRAVVINGHPFTIIGIAPPRFAGPDVFTPAEIWVPMAMHAQIVPGMRRARERESYWLRAVGRLAPGISRAEAQAAVAVLARDTARNFPATHTGFELRIDSMGGAGPHDRREIVPLSALLLGVTLTVLLIACANVANLLLARGTGRGREIGIRLAVGGTRHRIIRQLLLESATLAVAGGAAGLLLAMWGTEALLLFAGAQVATDTTPDLRVLSFTAALAVLTTLAFGLLPALRASGLTMLPALRQGVGSGAPHRSRTQRVLVAGQLALSLVLLTGAGLMLHSMAAARRADIGFQADNRFTLAYDTQLQGYSDARAHAFHTDLLGRVQALSGVRRATLAMDVPAGGRVHFTNVYFSDRPVDPDVRAESVAFNVVWPGFFETMGIRIVSGRAFRAEDARGEPVTAVVSETFAARYWPGEPTAIGQRFRLGAPDSPMLEVIGVAANVLLDEYTERPSPFVYTPHSGGAADTALIVETSGDLARVIPAVVGVFSALDPNLPTGAPMTFAQHLAGRLDAERALMRLLGVAGALALLLAALGLYGVMAHSVQSRVREIGVRVALGASRRDVLRLFVGESVRLVLIGIACGLPLAVALSAVVASSLVGIRPGDPLTLAVVSAVLAATMVLAAYVPARRALGVEAAEVLKAE